MSTSKAKIIAPNHSITVKIESKITTSIPITIARTKPTISKRIMWKVVGREGFEPPTKELWVPCSNPWANGPLKISLSDRFGAVNRKLDKTFGNQIITNFSNCFFLVTVRHAVWTIKANQKNSVLGYFIINFQSIEKQGLFHITCCKREYDWCSFPCESS